RPTPVDNDTIVNLYIEQLDDEDYRVRRAAAEALGKLRVKSATDALARRVADDVMFLAFEEDKDAALEALRAIAPDRVQAALIAGTKSRGRNVRWWAMDRLVGLTKDRPPDAEEPGEAVVQALIERLGDDELAPRSVAAKALGKLRARTAADALARRV